MTDWPDNLIEALATAEWEADKLDDTLWDGDEGPPLYYHGVRAVLAALAEWCDGDLYDPTTGKRIEQETVGVDYCTEHAGIRNEDDHRCDFADGCETCNNSGVVTGFEGDAIECPRCDGEGVSSCALVPLFTLSPREDQP